MDVVKKTTTVAQDANVSNLPVQLKDAEDDSTDEVSSELETASSVDSSDDGLEAEVITDEFPFTVEDIM